MTKQVYVKNGLNKKVKGIPSKTNGIDTKLSDVLSELEIQSIDWSKFNDKYGNVGLSIDSEIILRSNRTSITFGTYEGDAFEHSIAFMYKNELYGIDFYEVVDKEVSVRSYNRFYKKG